MKRIHAGVIGLIIKAGPKLLSVGAKLAKLAKGLKIGKVGLAAASVGAYTWMFTWQFALIICIMLFVHESGHVWAMKRCGMKTRGFYFIPFIGGAAIADDAFPSRRDEVYVAIMGPIWGLALSAITALVYFLSEHPLFAAAASWMAMINLFNLLPVNPLDGGRIFKSIAFSVNSAVGLVFLIVGILLAGIAFFVLHFGLFLILLAIGVLDLLYEIRAYRRGTRLIDELNTRRRLHQALRLYPLYGRRASYDEEVAQIRADTGWMPPLTRDGLLGSIAVYAVVFFLLWSVMQVTGHVPGADVAMEILHG